ncbi:hypothetical protein ACSSWA_01360 [Melioribacter sp. Ez-97]|uniref:hypothetical protein n=1 Tax=Melioribacter sp. Ez-97 TaxID=3423434 RepID=UPI003EDA611A
MRQKLVKKMRKYVARNYKLTLGEALKIVCEEPLRRRIEFAFKVIFKRYKNGIFNN